MIVEQIEPSNELAADPEDHPSASASPPSDRLRPPAPAARLSDSSISLGTSRSGSFSVNISPGSGTWVATDTSHIEVSPNGSFTVNAPRSEPGCAGTSRTASETITISWNGTNSADGTTTARGTLTLTVSWEITQDKGYWVTSSTVTGGGYWSNCSPSGTSSRGLK
ncbi:hypothetical protein [Nonomuraea sp. NPDC049400]|uniref:hypothetical protein n=1 Tax=Nonomuraea sp. NPDC049400 TaxID=3364352 RepID=UPI0037955A29